MAGTKSRQSNFYYSLSSVCGSVGRVVASDTRDPRFESSHWQNFIYQLYNRKDKNKEKEAGNGPSIKNFYNSLGTVVRGYKSPIEPRWQGDNSFFTD